MCTTYSAISQVYCVVSAQRQINMRHDVTHTHTHRAKGTNIVRPAALRGSDVDDDVDKVKCVALSAHQTVCATNDNDDDDDPLGEHKSLFG